LKLGYLIPLAALSTALLASSGFGAGERASWGGDLPRDVPASREDARDGDGAAPGEDLWHSEADSARVERAEWISLQCRLLVYGTPGAVWEVLSTVRSTSMWYPHWKPERDAMRELTAPGDTIAFYVGDVPAGKSVVTWIERLKELRIVHEGAGGSELGRVRMKLEPAHGGVGLLYEETVPAAGVDLPRERQLVCKRAFLIKRLAEGEQ
jgi:hypothetical protein